MEGKGTWMEEQPSVLAPNLLCTDPPAAPRERNGARGIRAVPVCLVRFTPLGGFSSRPGAAVCLGACSLVSSVRTVLRTRPSVSSRVQYQTRKGLRSLRGDTSSPWHPYHSLGAQPALPEKHTKERAEALGPYWD